MLDYDRKKLGEVLKGLRENVGLTQANVSEKLGYSSAQFISNIERGISVVPLPALSRMIRLYKANFKVVERIILDGQEQMLTKKLTNVGSRKIEERRARPNRGL